MIRGERDVKEVGASERPPRACTRCTGVRRERRRRRQAEEMFMALEERGKVGGTRATRSSKGASNPLMVGCKGFTGLGGRGDY